MKESLNQLIEHLKQQQHIYFAFELLQIKHTCRYLLFWSFEHKIPKDPNHRIKITVKAKRTQTLKITKDFEEYIKDINSRYGSDSPTSNPYIITVTHNKWSRKYRRSPLTAPPPPLENPMKVTIQQSVNDVVIFSVDDATNWDTFLSFINHLRN